MAFWKEAKTKMSGKWSITPSSGSQGKTNFGVSKTRNIPNGGTKKDGYACGIRINAVAGQWNACREIQSKAPSHERRRAIALFLSPSHEFLLYHKTFLGRMCN